MSEFTVKREREKIFLQSSTTYMNKILFPISELYSYDQATNYIIQSDLSSNRGGKKEEEKGWGEEKRQYCEKCSNRRDGDSSTKYGLNEKSTLTISPANEKDLHNLFGHHSSVSSVR